MIKANNHCDTHNCNLTMNDGKSNISINSIPSFEKTSDKLLEKKNLRNRAQVKRERNETDSIIYKRNSDVTYKVEELADLFASSIDIIEYRKEK